MEVCMEDYFNLDDMPDDSEDTMTELLALQIIDNDDGDFDNEERILQAWQYLLDTEAYLKLAPHYVRKIEDLTEQGLIG